MNKPKRIYVVGHMGAGKFIFTDALAKKLGWSLVDANPSIERYIGLHASEILGEQGVAAFNQSQAKIIKHSSNKDNVVVLLEEYVVNSEECRALLSNEFVVYLQVSIPTQLERMKHGRVSSLPIPDLQAFLQKQHDDRDTDFEEVASMVVESVGYSDQQSEIDKIVERDVNKVLTFINRQSEK